MLLVASDLVEDGPQCLAECPSTWRTSLLGRRGDCPPLFTSGWGVGIVLHILWSLDPKRKMKFTHSSISFYMHVHGHTNKCIYDMSTVPYTKANVKGCCLVIYHIFLGPEMYLIFDLFEMWRQKGSWIIFLNTDTLCIHHVSSRKKLQILQPSHQLILRTDPMALPMLKRQSLWTLMMASHTKVSAPFIWFWHVKVTAWCKSL